MKKLILLCLFIILPLKVNAADISSAIISGPAEVSEGEEITLEFTIKFSGLDKQDIKTKGVYSIGFEFEVSKNDLLAISYSSDFNTTIVKDEQSSRYVVYSEVQSGLKDTCLDNYLFCGDYKLKVNFIASETNQPNVVVKYNEISALVYPVELEDIKAENFEEIDSFNRSGHTINIKKSESEIPKVDVSSQIESKPNVKVKDNISSAKAKENWDVSSNTPSTKSEAKKSSNNYIKNLKIKNYNIDFTKEKDYYDVEVEDGVNELEVIVELEDKNAKYDILGAENLKDNDYKVLIEVTSEDGQKRTYTLKVNIAYKDSSNNNCDESVQLFGKNISKKYIIFGLVGITILILLIVLRFVCNILKEKVGNRKVKKVLKEIEKK